MVLTVNGKEYPLWSQFVEKKEEWIGGDLEELCDSSPVSDEGGALTKITDIALTPNGKDSAYFMVHGEEFDCGFDVEVGGISGGEAGWITLHGYGGHTFRVKKAEKEEIKDG